jgi:hypothetical protein
VLAFVGWILLNLVLLVILAWLLPILLDNEALLIALVFLPLVLNAAGLAALFRLSREAGLGALLAIGLLLVSVIPCWFCLATAIGLGA